LWFWARASLRTADISRKLSGGRSVLQRAKCPDFEIVVAESDGLPLLESETREYEPIVFGKDRNWRLVGKAKLIAIRFPSARLRESTGATTFDLGQVSSAEMITAPPIWRPNPAHTSCYA
jgi:hypothetical protein